MAEAVALIDRVQPLTDWLVRDFGYQLTADGDQHSTWGASVELRSAEFVVTVGWDRGHESITVGTTVRPGPRKPLRWWPLVHVVGFLDRRVDPYRLVGLDTEVGWLRDRRGEVLSVPVLNSEELRRWAVRASRRLFGQRPRW
jgi:hypothetical protein